MLDDVAGLLFRLVKLVGGHQQIPHRQARLEMVRIQFDRLTEFFVTFRIVLQVQLSISQLKMGLGITRINLQGFL